MLHLPLNVPSLTFGSHFAPTPQAIRQSPIEAVPPPDEPPVDEEQQIAGIAITAAVAAVIVLLLVWGFTALSRKSWSNPRARRRDRAREIRS